MDAISSDNAIERLTRLWSSRNQKSNRIPSDLSLTDHGKQAPDSEKNTRFEKHQKFSDEDIDVLLKKSKIERSVLNRQNARFLLRHHFQISKELFYKINLVAPGKPLNGTVGEAFVAALAKLDNDQFQRGYEIILQSIEAHHGSVIGSLKELLNAMKSIVSDTYHLNHSSISGQEIREAFVKVVQFWESVFEDSDLQLRLLTSREGLIKEMVQMKKMIQNLERVFQYFKNEEHIQNFIHKLRVAFNKADMVMKLLFSDAILSREDSHHHLLDQGLCFSIGTMLKDHIHPGRMWLRDKNGNSGELLDAENLKLFFRWYTDELGVVEAEMKTERDDIKITFASEDHGVVKSFDENAVRLRERLDSIGFESEIMPTLHHVKVQDEDTEIENISIDKMRHLDAKA